MKRIFATEVFFKNTKIEDIKLGVPLLHIKTLEKLNGKIVSGNLETMGNDFDEAIEKINKKIKFIEVPTRWDWDENMNPFKNNEHYQLLCQYFPYFSTKEAIEKINKIKDIMKSTGMYQGQTDHIAVK